LAGGFTADGGEGAIREKMTTFAHGKKRGYSRHYAEFMSTFVYLLEKAGLGKSRT
jgi:hypothetical protein